MTMSKVDEDEGRDKYEPIKRLAMVQIQPPRNPSKPFTSFCIKDILGSTNKESSDNDKSEDCFHHQNNQMVNSQYHQHHHGDQHSPQKQISFVPHSTDDNELSHGRKTHANITSVYNKSHRRDTKNSAKDNSGGLLNLCKAGQTRGDFQSMLSVDPPHLSAPINGRHKSVLSGLPSPLHHLPHRDILQSRPQVKPVNLTTKIVRPWDSDAGSHSPSSKTSSTPSAGAILTASEASSDEEEEISVDDDEPPVRTVVSTNSNKNKSVSPLDALMAMTSKTFEGLDGAGSADAKRRDQAALFGKHHPPKKRRKSRTAFTNQQIYELEKRFLYQKYLTPADRDEIAASLGLTNAQVITWFQNRRAKLKRDLEELKNDVTAAKKLPVHKATGSHAEMELRKMQEKTLRDSFNSGGLQSPSSSLASLSDEAHDTNSTPVQSPGNGGEEELLSASGKTEEPMDTHCSDNDQDIEKDNDIITEDNHRGEFCNPVQKGESLANKCDSVIQEEYRSGYTQDRQCESECDVAT